MPSKLGQYQAGKTVETDKPHRNQEISVCARDRAG
jgi:hypothetical protein